MDDRGLTSIVVSAIARRTSLEVLAASGNGSLSTSNASRTGMTLRPAENSSDTKLSGPRSKQEREGGRSQPSWLASNSLRWLVTRPSQIGNVRSVPAIGSWLGGLPSLCALHRRFRQIREESLPVHSWPLQDIGARQLVKERARQAIALMHQDEMISRAGAKHVHLAGIHFIELRRSSSISMTKTVSNSCPLIDCTFRSVIPGSRRSMSSSFCWSFV